MINHPSDAPEIHVNQLTSRPSGAAWKSALESRIRSEARKLFRLITDTTPKCRDQRRALDHLRRSMDVAISSVGCMDEGYDPEESDISSATLHVVRHIADSADQCCGRCGDIISAAGLTSFQTGLVTEYENGLWAPGDGLKTQLCDEPGK